LDHAIEASFMPPVDRFQNRRALGLIAPVHFASKLTWGIVRAPILAVLTLIEPVVTTILAMAMTLGVLVSAFFEFSAVGPRFPFTAVVTASVGCGAALVLFHGLIALLSD
jgi:hypothetical protein